MSNHHCPGCDRHDLSDSAFDFTATGRRKKYCRRCSHDRRYAKLAADMKQFRLRQKRALFVDAIR